MQDATGTLGNEARSAIGSGGREQPELCGVSGNVSSGRDASHGYPHEHAGDRAHICKARDQSSVKESKYVARCRNRTADNHKCEGCGKLFHQAHNLVRHYRTHTDERPYKCEICGKSFSNVWTLRAHQLTHSDERPHVCYMCTTAFKTKWNLKSHLNLKCRYRASVCDICNQSFMDNLGLSHHPQSMHGDKTPYECVRCGFSFAGKETLDKHLCQSYKCYLCGNSLGDLVQLIAHLITHSGEQPYPDLGKWRASAHPSAMEGPPHGTAASVITANPAPGMLLKPEEESSNCPAVPAGRFPADGTPHTGNPANDIETSAMAEESSHQCMPLDLSMKAEATQRTSRRGTQGASSTWGAYRTISDDALRYPGNTHHTPTTDETCNVDGVTENGSTSYQHLGFIGNIDHARPSTSRAGMEEASPSFEDGAMNATETGGREQQLSCGDSRKVSSRRDASHGQPNERTRGTAPMFSARDRSPVNKSNHKCETCGKLLGSAATLTAHHRTHTGERPYICGICHKLFAHKTGFHTHKLIHTGLKPHICQNCTKAFKSKAELKVHVISHSNDRPFICDICNQSFKYNSALSRHRKRIHEGK
nr:zinc finger protein 154-like [Dermacentor andersoni]